ncbi:hypothetical protein H6A18_11365, partial [Collinsella tanakaei]|uniref:hypothetical protein n=1 Tax=Collinsella tanakaei TaxID=626935 RepID=UPI001958C333
VLTFDIVDGFDPATESGSGKTIALFFSKFIKNRKGASNIVPWHWSLAGTLGDDDDGTMVQIVKNANVNEATITLPQP